jgi:hypothetical protein
MSLRALTGVTQQYDLGKMVGLASSHNYQFLIQLRLKTDAGSDLHCLRE